MRRQVHPFDGTVHIRNAIKQNESEFKTLVLLLAKKWYIQKKKTNILINSYTFWVIITVYSEFYSISFGGLHQYNLPRTWACNFFWIRMHILLWRVEMQNSLHSYRHVPHVYWITYLKGPCSYWLFGLVNFARN